MAHEYPQRQELAPRMGGRPDRLAKGTSPTWRTSESTAWPKSGRWIGLL